MIVRVFGIVLVCVLTLSFVPRAARAQSMENGCGIYRRGPDMQATCDTIDELKQRYKALRIDDRSKAWNTSAQRDWPK